MSQGQWQVIKENFGEKEFIEGNYYRLRQKEAGQYELSILKGGVCGEAIYHPRIILKEEGNVLTPISLYDNYETPVISLSYEEDPERLTDALQNLMQQFISVKEL
ncbi:hypothetical protein P7G51_08410 [Enterococcus asini]|uniref:hypothetical protein n=1 Tax=Enterococcus asini TaxID=57732 RepID=UPI00288F5F7C|nr:hypothetical protein [Enterococcus asini]MDT2757403.1 hypothetical protein [Enterococcus asini]